MRTPFAWISFVLVSAFSLAASAEEEPVRAEEALARVNEGPVRAEEPPARVDESPKRKVDWTFDANAGVGAGTFGLSAQTSVLTLGWVTDSFGIGAAGGVATDSKIFGGSSDAEYIAPTIAYRTAPSDTYAYFLLGGGIAHRSIARSEGFCIFDPCSSSRSSSRSEQTGLAANAAIGLAFHLGGFEIGPMIRADSLAGGSTVTLNLVLGGVALGKPDLVEPGATAYRRD